MRSSVVRKAFAGSLLLFAAATGLALDPHQGLRHYGYQSWQTDSGLPQNTVHAVLQSRDGYLWIGTDAGLVRFDGTQFTTFTHKTTPQLGSDLIYSLKEDRSGTLPSGVLWIGTSSGITRYANGVFQSFSTPQAASTIWSFYQDKRGSLWALTSSGLEKFDGKQFSDIPNLPALSETAGMLEDPDGVLWISTTNGLYRAASSSSAFTLAGQPASIQAIALDNSGRVWAAMPTGLELCTPQNCSEPFPSSSESIRNVRTLAADPHGTLWIGADTGLFAYDGTRLRAFTLRDGLPSGHVSLLYLDRQNSLWIGTDAGLARLVNNKIEAFTPREGFSSNVILAMLEDREGSLWLGTESGGLDILRDRTFTTYTAQDGIADDHIRSVYQDHRGQIWLGTSGGGLDRQNAAPQNPNRDNKDAFSTLTTADGLSSNIVLSIASDAAGDLWLGTPDGLNRLHKGKVTVFTSADGLADDFVRSLYFDPSGTLWIGTRRGLSQLKNGKFTTFTALDGLGSDLVGAILQSHDGGLWISTLGGLTRRSAGSFRNYTERDGLSNHIITALHEDPDGTLWIGTNGGGLNRWRNGAFKAVALPDTALPANIYSVLADHAGNLWIGSNDGIYRVNRDALNRYLDSAAPAPSISAFGVADGMRISECSSGGHPAAWRMQDGSLWFATLKGVATVDPAHLAINRVPPLLSIEKISVDDLPENTAAALTIPPGRRRFAFEYTALSFVAPQKVRYKYRLDGFDHTWVDAGTRRTAYYTNLPPGRYTFRVIAANNDGLWSELPANVSFRLEPFFYQTLWFYLLLTLAVALLGYGGYYWRVRHVESRFQAVLAERNRIAREIHDTLAQGFVAVSVQLQVASRLLNTSTDAARKHLDQAQEMVRSGLEDARKAIWELRSQSAESRDLATQLVKMADSATASTPIQTEVRVSGTYRPLPEKTENELLRIAKEAVTNAVRHAEPSRVEIRLRFEGRRVELAVEDDGRGFAGPAPSMEQGHFGLTGMKERAQQIGGTLTVDSKAGQGTRVLVAVESDEKREVE